MGSNVLKMFGQCDKVWICDKGFFITDWKTNEPKKWSKNDFTRKMEYPFNEFDDYAITHYEIQLVLYGLLFQDMLKGSKYENLTFLGGSIVRLNAERPIGYKINKLKIETIIKNILAI